MNKRELILDVVKGSQPPDFVPAAFFMHFDPAYHRGQAAINRHLEFFRATGMDFVKVQFEQPLPPHPIERPQDWANAPLYPAEFFDAQVAVAEGLVKAAKSEALVIMTLYSPFMRAGHLSGDEKLVAHFKEDAEVVGKGLEIMTQNAINLARRCKAAGVDGFYASTQGGEAFRFGGTEVFTKYIQPSDLAVWDELKGCTLNILHVCDFDGGYDDLTPFVEYPGDVVNASLTVGGKTVTARELSEMFGRPYMGGMERKGVIATGSADEIRHEVLRVLEDGAPDRFTLAADCTIPSETPWENLKVAIDTAHAFRRKR